jgi:hypothetical protein
LISIRIEKRVFVDQLLELRTDPLVDNFGNAIPNVHPPSETDGGIGLQIRYAMS